MILSVVERLSSSRFVLNLQPVNVTFEGDLSMSFYEQDLGSNLRIMKPLNTTDSVVILHQGPEPMCWSFRTVDVNHSWKAISSQAVSVGKPLIAGKLYHIDIEGLKVVARFLILGYEGKIRIGSHVYRMNEDRSHLTIDGNRVTTQAFLDLLDERLGTIFSVVKSDNPRDCVSVETTSAISVTLPALLYAVIAEGVNNAETKVCYIGERTSYRVDVRMQVAVGVFLKIGSREGATKYYITMEQFRATVPVMDDNTRTYIVSTDWRCYPISNALLERVGTVDYYGNTTIDVAYGATSTRVTLTSPDYAYPFTYTA